MDPQSNTTMTTGDNDVDDETDLTTLVGDGNEYGALVDGCFRGPYGNLKWKQAKLLTYSEFLNEYAGDNTNAKLFLMSWIEFYGLKDRFKQETVGEWCFAHSFVTS